MQAGDTVIVRISGEPVYIVEVRTTETGDPYKPTGAAKGQQYFLVRRANQSTEGGTSYEVEGFLPGELHTFEQRMQEEFDQKLLFYRLRKASDAQVLALDKKYSAQGQAIPEQSDLFN